MRKRTRSILSAVVPVDTVAAIDSAARAAGVTRSRWARSALEDAVRREQRRLPQDRREHTT